MHKENEAYPFRNIEFIPLNTRNALSTEPEKKRCSPKSGCFGPFLPLLFVFQTLQDVRTFHAETYLKETGEIGSLGATHSITLYSDGDQ